MSRLKDAQCYLNLTLFQDQDLAKCKEIASSQDGNSTEQFIDMIQSLANKCGAKNKELEKELRQKQKESLHKQRLNARKINIDKIRDDTRNMRLKADEMKTSVGNRAKELVGYEQQQRITMQALDRESSQISKE